MQSELVKKLANRLALLDDLVVNTDYGKVRGRTRTSCLGENYFSFQGIPYARPPVGDLRFKDPEPPVSHTEILDATKKSPVSFARNPLTHQIEGSEDCLYLNIYVKKLLPSKLYPVMVFIHGGAFRSGSGSRNIYGPDYILMHDVVLVTLNYRLGPLGFLSLNNKDLNVPGNAGLKDQLMALKWVKNNIMYFGGDSDNITLFGESAGGCSVHYHCISDLSKGLFNKAIIMSGTALNEWGLPPKNDWAIRLAKLLGYEGGESEENVLKYLQEADPKKIVTAQELIMTPEEIKSYTLFPFAPVIEPYITERTFVPESPVLMARKAWSNHIDIIIGGVADEGLFMMPLVKKSPEFIKNLELKDLIPLELKVDKNLPLAEKFTDNIKNTYYKNSDPNTDEQSYYKLMGDKLFWHGIHRTILSRRHFAKHSRTYLYRFNMDSSTNNLYKILMCGPFTKGTCHGDDMSYVFKQSLWPMPSTVSPEFAVIKQMVSCLVSFATSGKPNNPELKNIYWKKLKTAHAPWKCLDISDHAKVIELPNITDVWDSMYIESNINLY